MKWLKRLLILVLVIPILAVLVFWGVKSNFPGGSVAGALENQIRTRSGIPVQLSPVELHWRGFFIPEMAVMRAPAWKMLPRGDLIVMEAIEVLFWPLLVSQRLQVDAESHGGKFDLDADILAQNEIRWNVKGIQLNQVPGLAKLPFAEVDGRLKLDGIIQNPRSLVKGETSFPEGTISGNVRNMKLRLIGMALLFPDLELPPIEFSEIRFEVGLGPLVRLKRVEVEGMLSGSIRGTMQFNPKNPGASVVDLMVQLTSSPELNESLGSLLILLSNYQCGNRIDVSIKGPLNRLQPPKRRNCS